MGMRDLANVMRQLNLWQWQTAIHSHKVRDVRTHNVLYNTTFVSDVWIYTVCNVYHELKGNERFSAISSLTDSRPDGELIVRLTCHSSRPIYTAQYITFTTRLPLTIHHTHDPSTPHNTSHTHDPSTPHNTSHSRPVYTSQYITLTTRLTSVTAASLQQAHACGTGCRCIYDRT